MRRFWIWIRHPWHALALHLAGRRGAVLIDARMYVALGGEMDYLFGGGKERNARLRRMLAIWQQGIWHA